MTKVFLITKTNNITSTVTITPKLIADLEAIFEKNFRISNETFILLVYDQQSKLAAILAEAYKQAIKKYTHKDICFDTTLPDYIINEFNNLPKKSLVILIQSLSFRITKDRLRADLFRKGHMVIEHSRLGHNGDDQIKNYLQSLQYDTPYYTVMCDKIDKLLSENTTISITSGNKPNDRMENTLIINSEYETPIKNTGEFFKQAVPAAGFPIGEIFTEAKQLDAINGKIIVYGFPGLEHITKWCDPFTVTIKDGFLVEHNGPKEFDEIITLIKSEELGKVQIREIGFGLNRALHFDNRLDEPTAFERYAGVHFSLGLKHKMYRKKFPKSVLQKYHIDIFCKADTIKIGNALVFKDGEWIE